MFFCRVGYTTASSYKTLIFKVFDRGWNLVGDFCWAFLFGQVLVKIFAWGFLPLFGSGGGEVFFF